MSLQPKTVPTDQEAAGSARLTDGQLREKTYSALYRKFILLTFICSMIPLLLVGGGIHIYYSKLSIDRMVNQFADQVEYHRRIIELLLKERVGDLKLISFTRPLNDLRQYAILQEVYEILNEGKPFLDLGVLNAQGRHLAYIGPYDLMENDYSHEFWFEEVKRSGVYVSDVFTGFRNIPHFVMAVARSEGSESWIIRATMDSEMLRSLVEDIKIGETGEAYLTNREGTFQTSPRFSGRIMEKAPLPLEVFNGEKGVFIQDEEGGNFPRQVVAYAWLKDPRWVLVVRQNYSEALRDVSYADQAMVIFLFLSLFAILSISAMITHHMVKIVRNRDQKEEQLNKELFQASKLASVGELAAGVAHEINNPLAIIMTENQIIMDLCTDTPSLVEEFKFELYGALTRIDTQVQHCNQITRSLLGFSRHSRSVVEKVDLNALIEEIVALMAKQVRAESIEFLFDLEKSLLPIPCDPSQLRQVLMNLISNAIDAQEGKSPGTISIKTRSDCDRKGIEVVLADTGSGISPENLEQIMDPFFTTKPAGKGTGLGLSISYGIIRYMGGELSVKSTVGHGTEFTLFLPF